jgi:hypothetical protein
LALVKANAKANAMGISTNVIPMTAAGAISHAAVSRCERAGFSKRRCL